ncbi:MFS transporter [Pseudomonas sp. MTM4]|uniref:MFS transporter n=1 Tax=unclassified Pseudomonas TaxID=196821 RepID=UPI0018D215F7|nr:MULTISPECIES: MFS transporter [unclassified Pseudomonas]MBC8650934.1 MFS transporter [Pseudomonas sp. MT4]QXY94089.1 MFS transporter [Pseudomonas sp. MTM4]
MLALVLAAINLRPGITSFAPLIERIAEELNLSRGLISLTTALPVLLMGLLAPLAPRLAMRFGLERTIALCLGVIGLALVLRLFGESAAVLIGTAAMVGAGIAVAGPLLSGFIKRHFLDRMGKTAAFYSLSMAVGGTIGVVLTAPATQLLDQRWTLGLSLWAIPAVLALALWWRLPSQPEAAVERQAGLPWSESRAWLVSIFFALQAGLFYALATWLVARYHEAGFSVLQSNAFFSGFMLIGLPSSFAMPWLAQRFGNRHLLMSGCGLLATICLLIIAWVPQVQPLVVCMLLGVALNGTFSMSLILPMYEASTPLAVSRLTAMMLCTGYCLACFTPVLTGLGRDVAGDYRWPFLVLAGMSAVMCVLALRLAPRRDLAAATAT